MLADKIQGERKEKEQALRSANIEKDIPAL